MWFIFSWQDKAGPILYGTSETDWRQNVRTIAWEVDSNSFPSSLLFSGEHGWKRKPWMTLTTFTLWNIVTRHVWLITKCSVCYLSQPIRCKVLWSSLHYVNLVFHRYFISKLRDIQELLNYWNHWEGDIHFDCVPLQRLSVSEVKERWCNIFSTQKN